MFITVIEQDGGKREICLNVAAIVSIQEIPRDSSADSRFRGAIIELANGKEMRPTDGYESILGQLEGLHLKSKPPCNDTVTPPAGTALANAKAPQYRVGDGSGDFA